MSVRHHLGVHHGIVAGGLGGCLMRLRVGRVRIVRRPARKRVRGRIGRLVRFHSIGRRIGRRRCRRGRRRRRHRTLVGVFQRLTLRFRGVVIATTSAACHGQSQEQDGGGLTQVA